MGRRDALQTRVVRSYVAKVVHVRRPNLGTRIQCIKEARCEEESKREPLRQLLYSRCLVHGLHHQAAGRIWKTRNAHRALTSSTNVTATRVSTGSPKIQLTETTVAIPPFNRSSWTFC